MRTMGLAAEDTEAPDRHSAQADRLRVALFERMPAAIFANISSLQPAEAWARQVIADLIGTLETLVRVARVEEAERAFGLRIG